ncbi:hypothetical protein CPB84DRAFT_1803572, partial [Gymnopilus junonius]
MLMVFLTLVLVMWHYYLIHLLILSVTFPKLEYLITTPPPLPMPFRSCPRLPHWTAIYKHRNGMVPVPPCIFVKFLDVFCVDLRRSAIV